MNKLPDDVLDTIYKFKHQIEYAKVMDEIIQHKINCRYNVTTNMLKYIFNLNECGIKVCCIDVSSIEVFSFEILDRIKKKSCYELI